LAGGYDEEVFSVLVGEEGFYFWLVAAWALCGLGRRREWVGEGKEERLAIGHLDWF
jgi:hypothetical protein